MVWHVLSDETTTSLCLDILRELKDKGLVRHVLVG